MHNTIGNKPTETFKTNDMKDVYLTQEQFEEDLEDCLTIINYPNSSKEYYLCKHFSDSSRARFVKIFIVKNK